ncbi:DUF4232 domain-containing protein [Streptomyces sp. NPDC048595]|uniref:DUF4232 domain-containing protein n=1 Tax=Streptomyces sp. NPDC048595 TaxID=3365576 RepID=UPI003719B7BC
MLRIRPRTAVAATAAVLAALSLTACQGSSADAGSPAKPADGATAHPEDKADGNGNSNSDGTGESGSGNGGSGHGSGSGSGAEKNPSAQQPSNGGKAPGRGTGASDACTGGEVTATITKVPRPINHLLLTVTNKGSRPCSAYFAPSLRFDDDQSATQVDDDSKPQAVVTLAPGRSAYASVLLSGEGGGDTHGRTAKKLTVYFTPRSGSGSVGAPLTLSLPAGTHKDDNAAVTYWQTSASDALLY